MYAHSLSFQDTQSRGKKTKKKILPFLGKNNHRKSINQSKPKKTSLAICVRWVMHYTRSQSRICQQQSSPFLQVPSFPPEF